MSILDEIYGKNINFLFGSGASFGEIPTLATKYSEEGKNLTIEEIIAKKEKDCPTVVDGIYHYYYYKILKKCFLEDEKIKKSSVFKNYCIFLKKTLSFLKRENYQKNKRINIFTTNYDLFFEKAADTLIGKEEFYFNDGSSGNINKRLSMKNYHKKILHLGIFENMEKEIHIINLFKIHGSVSWRANDEEIYVEYKNNFKEEEVDEEIEIEVIDDNILTKELEKVDGMRNRLREHFVLIFPEKEKFEKTVFEEFYYQTLRQLSYELEKPNSILIVFGFSFADKHIAEMIKRALNNPTLKIYIYCFNNDSEQEIKDKLNCLSSQIEYISPEDKGIIDFNIFLKKVFGSDNDD